MSRPRYTLNPRTGTVHRDPGCARIFVNSSRTSREELQDFDHEPPGKRCFYCYSKAGYRRHPTA